MRALERRILTIAAALSLVRPAAAWPADAKPRDERAQVEEQVEKPKDEKPREPAAVAASAAWTAS